MPVVHVDVDRLSKKKRFIESVELLLNRLRPPLNVGNVATDLSLALLPGTQHMLFHEPHVARSRLQLFQLVDEQPFQLPFRQMTDELYRAVDVFAGKNADAARELRNYVGKKFPKEPLFTTEDVEREPQRRGGGAS